MATKKTTKNATKKTSKKTSTKNGTTAPTKPGAAQQHVNPPVTSTTPAASIVDRGREQLDDVAEFAREVVTTSIGLPFALQSRLGTMPKFELAAVASLLDDAKAQGATRVAALQDLVDPVAATVQQRAGGLACLVAERSKQLRDRIAA